MKSLDIIIYKLFDFKINLKYHAPCFVFNNSIYIVVTRSDLAVDVCKTLYSLAPITVNNSLLYNTLLNSDRLIGC
jgi:hypothetical protein